MSPPSFTLVWEFQVRAGREEEFRALYGPEGAWAQLFALAPGFIATRLLEDRDQPGRFLTLDQWLSAEAWQDFRIRFAEQYAALDRRGDELTQSERSLGAFDEPQAVLPDEPSRVIVGLPSARPAFVGWTAEGPAGAGPPLANWPDFAERFGGLDRRSPLTYSVYHYFANGGGPAAIVRLDSPQPLAPDTPLFEERLLEHGLAALDAIDHFDLLAVPAETTPAVVARLQDYVVGRRAFLLVDAAPAATDEQLRFGLDPVITGPAAANSALYFPWIEAADPLGALPDLAVPPCGFVAGIYARSDAAHGVWKSPAGREAWLVGATGLSAAPSEASAQALNARGINCIRQFPPGEVQLWGARTLAGSDTAGSEWKYVGVRRLALFVEDSVARGIRWAVGEPNRPALREALEASCARFLHQLWRAGALAGRTPREAYFVQVESSPESPDAVQLTLGIAPLRPAEFLLLHLTLPLA